MANKFILGLSTICLILLACKKVYSPLDYKNWIESELNGLRKNKTIGKISYELQYETPEYKILMIKGPVQIGKCDIAEETKPYSGLHCFNFTITTFNGVNPVKFDLKSQEEFYARQEYLNSNIQNDFFLLNENKDTVKCVFAHSEREFGIAPHLKIDLAFEKQEQSENFKFCYNDRMFNNGMIKFSFDSKLLNDLPELSCE